MEKLLDIARKVSDQVEIYSNEQTVDSISFEDAKLKDIDSKLQSGTSIRIIKDGRLGFAFTKNLIDEKELVNNALASLKGGVEAKFNLPFANDLPHLNTYDPSIEDLTPTTIVDECNRIARILVAKTDGQVNIHAGRVIAKISLKNSNGLNLSVKSSHYYCSPEIMYPGSYASISRVMNTKKFGQIPGEHLDFILDIYNKSVQEAIPGSDRMKVLFLPETIYVLLWRLQSATSGKSIYEKQSPIADKLGKKLFSSNLTIYNDPLNDQFPGARTFDDEGTPGRYFPIVEDGVLKNFYYDLHYADKLDVQPTGHGFRSAMWGGEAIANKPSPTLAHLYIKPGDKSFSDMIRSIDRGVIVASALGAHSGNIPNGDFSIGLSPGLYVENGEIVGYVKDAMVAGNIYETMKNLVAIEDRLYPAIMGTYPALLFDDVNVTTK
ncbi:TldD/PmbA family protein [Candidatus Acetothermia bacterium]|jgi:PmbA protein|nr:TldD/PmbA family protein [Candidatus Acetothermia bacterium]MCI2426958.1 TldD/PmbA family protein [Candidatus Acetothermia bacterium]MCI2428520.1 TldD/PmbA family protein [Candidatus Acetothermia bacterium]